MALPRQRGSCSQREIPSLNFHYYYTRFTRRLMPLLPVLILFWSIGFYIFGFMFLYNSCIVVVECSFSCMHIIYLALIHCSYLLSPLLYTLLYFIYCKHECSYCQVQKYRSCCIADKSISTEVPRLLSQRLTSVRLHISCTSASPVVRYRVPLSSSSQTYIRTIRHT